jgi:hypothetical protein
MVCPPARGLSNYFAKHGIFKNNNSRVARKKHFHLRISSIWLFKGFFGDNPFWDNQWFGRNKLYLFDVFSREHGVLRRL